MASPLPVPLIASAVGALGTFLAFNAQGASVGTGLPAAAIVGLLLYYFIQVVTQQPNLQPTESVKPKKKTKQEKPKQKPVSSSSTPSASSAASDEEDESVASAKKKNKKANKKAAAAAAAAAAAQPEDNESETSEASETSEGDDEDDSSSLSKNAKKKAKKKAAAAAAKKEEEKKAAAAAAAAAAAKKPTANKKEEKKSAPAPVAAQPTPAAASAKKEKKPTKESAPATPAQPAAVALAPPQEEEAFQQSKSDKKKKQKDEKAKKREEEKQTQSKPTEVPKTPTPISPAPTTSNKKQETKPQAAAAAPVSFSPPPAAEFEEGEWNIAKSAKPTSAQKKEIKAAESKSAESAPSSASNTAEPSDWIDIPVAKVAAIIGTKGAVLKALQEGTGATIEVPKAAERDLQSLTARILIRGEISQVKHAKSCVKSLAEKGYSSVTHPGFGDDDIYVEGKQHGLIIGPKGSTLKTIQTKTGTMIRMPEKGGNDRIIIVGPKDGVKQAKEAIKQLVSDGFSSLTHDGHEKKEIDFPASKLGILIGPGGQTIKSIQGNSKAQIKIPAREAENQKVIVTGPAAAIAQAEKEILKLLEPKVKKTNKPEEGKDDEESAVAGEATAEGANGDAAPQSAFDAWNAAEVPQVNNEDAMWQ